MRGSGDGLPMNFMLDIVLDMTFTAFIKFDLRYVHRRITGLLTQVSQVRSFVCYRNCLK